MVPGLPERCKILVAALTDQEKLELTEGVELEASALFEALVGYGQDVVWGERCELPVPIEETADEIEAG